MALIENYIHVRCDRCGTCMCFPSKQYAENMYWEFDIVIDDDHLDLCPDCNDKWNKLVRVFLDNTMEV